MNAVPLVAVVLLLLTSFSECSCPDGWIHHGNMCYHFSHDVEAMPLAALLCTHMGGTIVEIESAAENLYLTSQAKLYKYNFWTGLNDIMEEGIWTWYDSKRTLNSTGFHDWARHQPDNHHGQENCAYLAAEGHWADGPCRSAMHYVCEKIRRLYLYNFYTSTLVNKIWKSV